MAKRKKILIAKYFYPKGFKEQFLREARKLTLDVDFARWDQLIFDTASTGLENAVLVNKRRLTEYDLIYIRSIMNCYYEFTQLVNAASALGVRVVDKALKEGSRVNDLKAQQIARAHQAGIPVPRTIYATDTTLMSQATKFGTWPIVLKAMGLHRGQGVFLVKDKSHARRIMDKFIESKESKNFLLQEPIDYTADYRVLVIGNKALGAIQRIPQAGEFRANVSRGGEAKCVKKLPPKLENSALKMAQLLNFEIAGVDFMQDSSGRFFFLEANRAPGYEGFKQATGVKVEREILKYLKYLIDHQK
jgi:RimK family alpha-L-glutamate ligase